MRRFCQLAIVLAIAISGFAQNPAPPLATTQLQIPFSAGTLQPVSQASVTLIGNPGPKTYYYWLVGNYAIGSTSPAGPFVAPNSPNTLGASNYNQIQPVYPPGINSVDLLRTTTTISPSGACNCAVATGVTSGAINDQSNTRLSYTVNPTNLNALGLTLTNEAVGTGSSHLYLRQNGAFVVDLSVGGSGGAVWGSITGTLSNQTDLQNALNLKANLASPTFTGTVTIPTAAITTLSGAPNFSGTPTFGNGAGLGNGVYTGSPTFTGLPTFSGGADFNTGIVTMSGTELLLPSSSGFAPITSAEFGYDTLNNRLVFGTGTLTGVPIFLTASITTGQCPQFSGTTGLAIGINCTAIASGTAGQITFYTGSPASLAPDANLDDSVTINNALSYLGSAGLNIPNGGGIFGGKVTATALGLGSSPPTCGTGVTGCAAFTEGSTAVTPVASVDMLRADSSTHEFKISLNGGSEILSAMNLSAASSATIAGSFSSAPTGSKFVETSGVAGLLVEVSSIPLSSLAAQASNTLVMNEAATSAAPTAVALPTTGTNGCAGALNALNYNTTSRSLGCTILAVTGNTTTLVSANTNFTSANAGQVVDIDTNGNAQASGVNIGGNGFLSTGGGAVSNSATNWFGTGVAATEQHVTMTFAKAGTVSAMYCVSSVNTLTGSEQYTLTARHGTFSGQTLTFASTSLACTLNSTTPTTCNDTTAGHAFTYAANDTIDIQIVPANTPTAGEISCTLLL